MAVTVAPGFPPAAYSSAFFPLLLKVAGEQGLDIQEILSKKKGDKKPVSRLAKKWRTAARNQAVHTASGNSTQAVQDKRPVALDRLENQCSVDDLDPSDMTLLQLLALNALDLTAPASDVLLKNRKNQWVQLSGHEGAFAPAGPGTIWKKRAAQDDTEVKAYRSIMDDVMCDMVPQFYKEVEWSSDYYIEMQDLLSGFEEPSVMDIKMGIRTFTESEVTNQTARTDLYQKMMKVSPNAPTPEEHAAQAVTKLRYMTFREQQSSSSTLGFRIEALKFEGSAPVKDLKLIRTHDEVLCTMNLFLSGRDSCRKQLLERLKDMKTKLEKSEFFLNHEFVGSSILIVHDKQKAGAWMIDFAKTLPVPEGHTISHRAHWVCGNHEDGYLTGLDNLISVIESTQSETPSPSSKVKSRT